MKRTLLLTGALIAILVSALAVPKAQADVAFGFSIGSRHSGFSLAYAPAYRTYGYVSDWRERERSWADQRRNWDDDGYRADVGRHGRRYDGRDYGRFRDSGQFQERGQERGGDARNWRGFDQNRDHQDYREWGR